MDNSVGETTREDEDEFASSPDGDVDWDGGPVEGDEDWGNREGDPNFNGAFNRW